MSFPYTIVAKGFVTMTNILQNLVEEDFGYKKEGKNWGRAEEHSSLVVNEEKQTWYWNSENKGGNAFDYLLKVRNLDRKKAREILEIREKLAMGMYTQTEEVRDYFPYDKLVNLFWESGKKNRDYWYARKITDKTIDRYRLGNFNGWNFIPLYRNDVFVNFQCRRDIPEKRIKMWYRVPDWTPVLINPELLNLVDTIFITESPTDAILLTQEGIPAISQSGGAGHWNQAWYHLFSRIKDIYYIADNDDAGRRGAFKVATSLGEGRTHVFQFEGKKEKYDSGDYFKEGGNAKDFKQMVLDESKYLFEIGEMNEYRSGHRRCSVSLARKYL